MYFGISATFFCSPVEPIWPASTSAYLRVRRYPVHFESSYRCSLRYQASKSSSPFSIGDAAATRTNFAGPAGLVLSACCLGSFEHPDRVDEMVGLYLVPFHCHPSLRTSAGVCTVLYPYMLSQKSGDLVLVTCHAQGECS